MHFTTCKLNPANSIDVEDISAEQHEIDAILENIFDVHQIRIVRANTMHPNAYGNRVTVVNESFIVTCYVCGAQFEHYDVDEHLLDCHSDDVNLQATRDRYRQALVMLVGASLLPSLIFAAMCEGLSNTVFSFVGRGRGL